jgi:flagellin
MNSYGLLVREVTSEYLDMLSSFSALIAPAPLPRPRSTTKVPHETGTQLPTARVSARARDAFSVTLGTTEAAEIGALIGANRNVGEGVSLLQVADAGLDEISDALIRMKELATSASSATAPLSRGDRAIANAEFEALRTEVDNIVDRTEFNDIKVLEGVSLDFKVGSGNASQDSITVTLSAATIAGLNTSLAADTIASAADASQALTDVTSAIDALSTIQGSVDGAAARFRTAARNLTSGKIILSNLRTSLLERPVTIGTADYLANVAQQEFLSRAVPAAAGQLSSAARVLLSSLQVQPIESSQAEVRKIYQENGQVKAVKQPSGYEAGQNTKSSSPSETSHSVDLKA